MYGGSNNWQEGGTVTFIHNWDTFPHQRSQLNNIPKDALYKCRAIYVSEDITTLRMAVTGKQFVFILSGHVYNSYSSPSEFLDI